MKKALLISAIINILLAVLAYVSDITLIYPIILTTLAVIYISYQEQTITYLYNKKTKITIMAIINFIINPLSGISLLIGLDKLNTEYKNLKEKEKLKQLTKEEKQISLLLNLGIGLVSLSGIILIATNINVITPLIKLLILIFISLLFLILSLISKYKLKIEILEKNYWLISMLFMILTVIANGYLETISTWFSYTGPGKNLYIAFTSIIIALLSQITNQKYDSKILKHIIYIGILTSVFFILLQLTLPIELALSIINMILLLINITKQNKLTNYLIITTSIISTIYILESTSIILQLILSLTTIINTILITLKGNILEGIISPVLITTILLNTSYEIQNITEIQNLDSILLTLVYGIIYLLNILKTKNKTYRIIMNIITNIIFAALIIVNIENKLLLTLITLLITLTSIINYHKKVVEAEKILLPIKITTLIISIILLMQEIINPVYTLIIIYLLLFGTYILTKNRIKKISIILYYITFAIALFINETEILPCIINIIMSVIALLIISKENNDKHIKISYITLLLTLMATLTYTNILNTTPLINNILLLFIYIILTLATINQNKINKINYIAIILPLIMMTQDQNINNEIEIIINSSIFLYIVLLINKFLLKKENDKNILTTILTTLILLNTMFIESWTIGIYVGIIALILIIIGTLKKEYKGILIEGIIITIINILYQLSYMLKELPLWIYTLLAGLTLIGLVTYKITKNEKK